jgi:NodT family efflux transporter outer membrane factor (OMF) lipoprotein
MLRSTWRILAAAAGCFLILFSSGCTSCREYLHNGFKVGPNYERPPALVAEHWIDADDQRVRSQCDDLATWWTALNDPLLNQLIANAYSQNLTLREAGYRVLEARAQYGIAVGNLFPQQQDLTGSYTRFGRGRVFTNSWSTAFNLNWELDFWGRFRRAVQSADASLDASVFNYDDALVTLLSDVATNYVNVRTDQERLKLLDNTVKIQTDVYNFIDERVKIGFHGVTELDRSQALSNLKQSQAQMTQLRIDIRTSENRLCTLLGIPTVDLEPMLANAPQKSIPTVPDYVVVGIPADLLRRRPDIRRAERQAAAQAEQIGIAETDLYPAFSINGTLGWQASTFRELFSSQALNANVGPSFQWNLLNYGRIVNNMRFQDATFKELVATYQETVLEADEEVENGIVTFLQSQEQARLLRESVDAAYRALMVIIAQYENPVQAQNIDFNRYAVIVQNLIQQQDQWAQSRGQVDLGLIEVYRGLGGGWQLRLQPGAPGMDGVVPVQPGPGNPQAIPQPAPEAIPAPPAAQPPAPPQGAAPGVAPPQIPAPIPPAAGPQANATGPHPLTPVEPRILQPEKEPVVKGASE